MIKIRINHFLIKKPMISRGKSHKWSNLILHQYKMQVNFYQYKKLNRPKCLMIMFRNSRIQLLIILKIILSITIFIHLMTSSMLRPHQDSLRVKDSISHQSFITFKEMFKETDHQATRPANTRLETSSIKQCHKSFKVSIESYNHL